MVENVKTIKLNDDLINSLNRYQKTISYLVGDAPIGALCLPKHIEKKLLADGCLRVYDLLDRDLSKVEGFNKSIIDDLTSRVNKFLSMC